MENDNVTTMYMCGECREIYEDEYNAEECCRPDVIETFMCISCSSTHTLYDDAHKCCSVTVSCPNCARIHGDQTIEAVSIEVTNHCSKCNPFYSIDQQHIIECLADSYNLHPHKWR